MEVLEVGELTRYIGQLFKSDPLLQSVWVRGEIASLSRSPAGHCYFSLRGSDSQLRCVLFRGVAARLATRPERGQAVIVHGNVNFWEAGGECQVTVSLLYPEGVGLARMELEALRLKLEQEGLFDESRKRQLPAFPRRIGLVTSDGGAVLHDVTTVLERRYPLVEVVLSPTSVQGERAPAEICAALERLACHHRDEQPLDLIIVARGGGSEQDLAVFNDERVARAFYGCPVPIVSAIGHETDVTLVDYVADLRAPTPSAAAELVTPDVASLRDVLLDLARRARAATGHRLDRARLDTRQARDRLLLRSPAAELARRRSELGEARRRGQVSLAQRLKLAREQLHGRLLQAEALNPSATLERGYSVCTLESGEVLRSIYQVSADDQIDIRIRDGQVVSRAVARRLDRRAAAETDHGAGHGVAAGNV